jgi:hypothetical protein
MWVIGWVKAVFLPELSIVIAVFSEKLAATCL